MNPTHTEINAHKLASFADSFPSRPSNTQSEQESPVKPTSQVFRFRDSTGQGSEPESPQTGYFPNTTSEEGSSPEKAHRENSSPSEIDSSNMALPDQQNTENNKKKNKRSMVFHIEGEDSEPNPDDEEDEEESSPEVRPRARNDRVIYSPKGTMMGTKTQNKTEQKNYSSEEDEDSSPEIARSRNMRVVFSPRGGDYVRNTEIETTDGVTVIRKKALNQSFQEPKPKRKSDPISPRTYQEEKKRLGTSSLIYSRTQNKNSIIIPEQNKFMDPSQWSENLKCYVCDRVFDKTQGIHTHHCRACGRAVCGDCSRKKINNDRACDVCYKKIVDVSAEGARNKRLMEKMALLQAKEKYLQEAKQNFQELQKKRKEMEKIWMTELTDQANKSRALQDEKRLENEDLQKKLKENEKLKEELQVTQRFLKEKEEANSEVQELLLCVKSELSKQKKAKDNKLHEYENLVENKRSYNPSVVSCLAFAGDTDTSFTRDPKNVGSCDPNIFAAR